MWGRRHGCRGRGVGVLEGGLRVWKCGVERVWG